MRIGTSAISSWLSINENMEIAAFPKQTGHLDGKYLCLILLFWRAIPLDLNTYIFMYVRMGCWGLMEGILFYSLEKVGCN